MKMISFAGWTALVALLFLVKFPAVYCPPIPPGATVSICVGPDPSSVSAHAIGMLVLWTAGLALGVAAWLVSRTLAPRMGR